MNPLGSFETPDRRLQRLQAAMQSTSRSMGDTVTRAVDLEARRRTMEESLRQFRGVEQRQPSTTIRGLTFPTPPEDRPRPTMLDAPGAEELILRDIPTGRPGLFQQGLSAAAGGLRRGLGELEKSPLLGGPLARTPDEGFPYYDPEGRTQFERGAEISRPIVQAAQPIAAEPFEQIEAAGIPGVSPAAGGVSEAIQSQIVEDIATEIINPAALVLAAPIVMQGTQGLRGTALAAQMASNLLGTGMEPSLARGTLRGLSVVGEKGAAGLSRIPENIRSTPIIQEAVRNVREAPEGGFARLGGEGAGEAALRGEAGGFPERFAGKARQLEGGPPEPPKLPTVREVEARARPQPPEVRAQMMGEIEDPRVPLQSWDEFQATWNERYQENWWTKFEDAVGGPLARTPEEKAVRSAFVKGDLYREIQKVRMRALVWDWTGRNRSVLGLNAQGVAKKVQPVADANIPKKLVQRLDHITEHPEKYVITPEQQVALDDAQGIFAHVLQKELREGVDVEEVIGGYWRRLIKRTPSGKGVNASSSMNLPRVKPAHARSRLFGDIEDLARWDETHGGKMKLGSAIEGMSDRFGAAVDAISNRRVLNEVRNLGVKPSERVSQELVQEAKAAREAFKDARKAARGGGSTERAALMEAETELVNARRALRLDAKKVMERRPKVLGRLVTDEAADQVARFLDASGPGAIEEAFRLARAGNITGDLSAMGIQGWYTFWSNNPAWWMASFKGLEALVRNPYRFVVQNIDTIERGTRYGAIITPEEFLLRRGGSLTQRFGQLPIIRQTQNSFEWWTFTAQTLRWKAAERLAKTPDDLLELAGVIRNQTGVSVMPGLTKAQRRISQAFFAPKFLAAIFGSLKDVTRAGPAGAYARRTVAMAFGGAMSAVVAGNVAQNRTPNLTDPDKPGFLAVPVGKGYVYPMGPFQPLMVALFRSGRAANDAAQGKTPSARDLQAFPRFAEGKLNKYERAMIRALEALGVPISGFRGTPFRGPEIGKGQRGLLGEVGEVAPIGPFQAGTGIAEGAPITGLEVLGGRTTVRTPYQELQQAFKEELGREFNPRSNADWTLARQNERLAPIVEAAGERSLERGTEGARRAAATQESQAEIEQELELPRLARDFSAGNLTLGDDLVEGYYELQTQMAGVLLRSRIGVEQREPTTEDDRILRQVSDLNPNSEPYRDFATGRRDWDSFRADIEALREQLAPAVRKAYDDIVRGVSPEWRAVEPKVKKAIDLRSDLFETARHVDVTAEQEKEAAEFRGVVDKMRDRLAAQGLEPGDATMAQYIAVAEDEDVEPKVAYLAFALRPNSKGEVSLRDPAYVQRLLDVAEDVAPYFPDLYSARRILQVLPKHLQEVVIEGS